MGSYPRFCRTDQRPIRAVICLTPGIGMAAPDLPGVTRPHRRCCDETESHTFGPEGPPQDPAQSPCSQSHARPADRVATVAGGLLPHRFAPYQCPEALAGMLSVAVVVRTRLSPACPHLLFRGATLSPTRRCETGSREVPLGCNPPSPADCCPVTAPPSVQVNYTTRVGAYQVSSPEGQSHMSGGRACI
jgi:hypothetical protein